MKLTRWIPVPPLLQMKRILGVQPHPDDLELAAGATVALLAQQGAEVAYVTVTDGAAGSSDPALVGPRLAELRRAEQERAAEVLGVRELFWLNFPDGGNWTEDEVREALVEVIYRFQPEAVLLPDPWLPYEAHPDHRRVGLAGAAACLLGHLPALHRGRPEPLPPPIQAAAFYATRFPNTWVGVEKTWEQKLQALRCHASQFPPLVWEQVLRYLEFMARRYGRGHGGGRREAFKVLFPYQMHFFVDALDL
ncbi:MAG: PIG-L family deacetylase [Bacillota bacterium]|nr:PIG-L family deacetylase [Bacillota bacterium]